MLKMIMVTARDRVRLQEITGVLIRYGLQDIVKLLGLSSLHNKIRGSNAHDVLPMPQRLCAALEELGPTFVKLGQILSTRSDLLDPAWTEALSQLNSSANPLPWSQLEPQVIATLGAAPADVFASFDETPLASGSVAQIHRARLRTGDEVIVKIQRPGIETTLKADLRLLRYLAESLEQQSPALARFQPVMLVRYLENALYQELDFCHEAANGEKFYQFFAGSDDIAIPKIYPEWCSPTLMVQAFLPGIAPVDGAQLAAAGFDGQLLAQTGAKAFIDMLFKLRIYHADPHPGNVMALKGNRVGFIDFGMVGNLSEERRDELLSLIYAISERDTGGIVDALIVWSDQDSLNLTDLELAAGYFLQKQGNLRLQLGKALTDMLSTAREFRLTLPPDLVLLFKALITADGVLLRMDPQFDIISILRPVIKKEMLKRYSRAGSRRHLLRLGNRLLDGGDALPQTLRLVMQRLRHGKLHADINVENINQLGKSLERAASTLALALVLAALMIVVTPWLFGLKVTLLGIPLFPALALLCAVAGSVWLIFRLLRR
ncbi:AarF/ABC1/UbiB kinase family protein [Cedecea sp. P7760]|jgi:ubiquinone biosynthesis protein|uniref:ABC1 kinase family protein n=1 Tax=Cedecea sp. P7760 TaxID=2726983 RepID=UPI0015A16847|nr:AarF/UbiB family protein [Cedecea sp. P7760]NWC61696.1 AarF/ABC1/UbiB kinase family protein [Cedecea sp. P7760]